MSHAGDADICPYGTCNSYSLITDTNGDSLPDGPVTWIPATKTATETDTLARACLSADQFNSGQYRDPSGSVAVFIGDKLYHGDYEPSWDSYESQALTGMYAGNGHPVRCVLRESSYPDTVNEWPAHDAGRACLASGVQDLWVWGLATNAGKLTQFLVPPVSTTQRIMVFAPTCESANCWAGYTDATIRKWMFPANYGGGTLVAGAIGCITDGYDPEHDLLRDLIEYNVGISAVGTLYADIVNNLTDQLRVLDPDYARGVITFGGILKYPGGLSISSVAKEADRPGTKLQWIRRGSGGRFECNLSGTWNVTLEVYDLQGRRVATLDSGARTGKVVTPWNPTRVSSGLYFGRLEAHRGSEDHHWVTKVLVLH